MTWGKFRGSENKAVPAVKVDPRYEIREGDLLVSRANTTAYVGASVLVGPVRPRLLLSDKSLRIVPKSGVNREWLWRVLSSPVARTYFSAVATGTKDSMRNISQHALLQVQVPTCPFEVQSSVVAKSVAFESAVHRLEVDISSTLLRGERLRRSLLAAAFSGELTGQPSDMNRAEVLAGV